MTAVEAVGALRAHALLMDAEAVVVGMREAEGPLADAAAAVTRCAAGLAALLDHRSPETADEALRCARAAVVVATMVVRQVRDEEAVAAPS